MELSYDEDDDLDSHTIVALLDIQCAVGNIQALKDEFNRRRREVMLQL